MIKTSLIGCASTSNTALLTLSRGYSSSDLVGAHFSGANTEDEHPSLVAAKDRSDCNLVQSAALNTAVQ